MFSSVITHSPFTSIVDVTCELPQLHSFGNYLNIPTWDGTAPTLAEIDKAVDWIIAERSAGRGVLIHCWYQFLSVACFSTFQLRGRSKCNGSMCCFSKVRGVSDLSGSRTADNVQEKSCLSDALSLGNFEQVGCHKLPTVQTNVSTLHPNTKRATCCCSLIPAVNREMI